MRRYNEDGGGGPPLPDIYRASFYSSGHRPGAKKPMAWLTAAREQHRLKVGQHQRGRGSYREAPAAG